MIRPEALARLRPWRETAAAGLVLLAGLWTATRGGPVLLASGAVLAVLAAAWGLAAFRRMRFAQAVAAPGMVEVDEGQIGYLGPAFGGYVSLPDLVELRLLTIRGRRLWRLKQADGQALLIPVDAAGAERLIDAFASLPGLDSGALLAALHLGAGDPGPVGTGELRLVWSRPRPALHRPGPDPAARP
jgi:hypothetical protein